MTNLLNEKPDKPKEAVLQMLQAVQKKNYQIKDPHNKQLYEFKHQFLQQEDFESIFDSYDVLNIQQIPKSYLAHALKIVGVDQAEKVIAERYSDLVEDDTINKVSFVFVLDQEHKRLGFLNDGC